MLINELRAQHSTDVPMDGRVCVITGANSGVGLATAKRYAEAGAHVVMVCRSAERAAVARKEIEPVACWPVDLELADLSRLSDIHALGARLLDRYPKIHVLINNAGIHSTSRTFTEDGIETSFAVNHLAPFLLTRLLLERLRVSAPARVLNVNSQGHRLAPVDLNDLDWSDRPYRGQSGYAASKTANLLFTWELAEQLTDTGVTANAVHPGGVKSRIGHNNGAAWRLMHSAISMTLREPSVAGDALYYLGAAPELAETTGRFFNLTFQEKPHAHARYDSHRTLARHLWLLSEQLVGLTESRRGA